jgi:predicted HicB family RNase H-like nuclease
MMKHRGYVGRVEFDAEAGILHGEVVGIRDVVTFQGTSVREVERAFRESVDDYLAFCKQRGEEPCRPCSGSFVLRIDSELHRKANMLAGAAGKSLNAWVAECLNRAVARELPTPQRAKSSAAAKRTGTTARTKIVKV